MQTKTEEANFLPLIKGIKKKKKCNSWWQYLINISA